jgi:hypothetical protein
VASAAMNTPTPMLIPKDDINIFFISAPWVPISRTLIECRMLQPWNSRREQSRKKLEDRALSESH